jgi:O-antigen ligase
VLLIFSAFAVLLLLQMGFQSRLMSRLSGLTEFINGDPGGDRSAGTRMVYMTAAIHYWSDSPFTMMFGNGLFSFSTLLKGAYVLGTHPHNLVLNILSEFGLIGLLLYAGFVGSVVLGKGLNRATVTPLNGILWGIALGEVFRALVDTRLESSGTFLMSMCLLAALRAPLHAAGPSPIGRSRRPAAAAVSHPA